MTSLNNLITNGKKLDEMIGSTFPFDTSILTDDEKRYHVLYAIENEQRRYAQRMSGLGASISMIEERMANIDWENRIDKEQVLLNAAGRKYWHQERMKEENERKARQAEKMATIRATWTSDAFQRLILVHFMKKHNLYIENDLYKKYVATLCKFMADQENKRGLLITGPSGLGKTETLVAIKNNPLKPFSIVSILEIVDHVKENGHCVLNPEKMVAIDDVGSESSPVKYYGTEINWFKDYIEMTYLSRQNWSNIVLTTNLNGEEIEKKYGHRVRSRLREMFIVVNLNGEDLRK